MIDRRSRRTRELLTRSLVKLLLVKPLSKITVTELVKEADLNRATFYLHYGNIYDLFQSIEDDLFLQVKSWIRSASPDDATIFHVEIDRDDKPYLPVLEEVFNFIASNRNTASVLLRNPESKLLNRVCDEGREMIIRQVKSEQDVSDPVRLIYSIDYIVNGCIGIIQSWINNGLDADTKTMCKITCDLVMQNRADLIF